MEKFDKLKMKEGKLKFADGRKLMIGDLKGTFTRNEIVEYVQSMSNYFKDNDKKGQIGVSYHFKNNNVSVPSVMSSFGDHAKVWDITDSDRGQAYIGDIIDSVQFHIINNDDGKYKNFRKGKFSLNNIHL